MFSSTNEMVGFSAVGQEELEAVNGGDLGAGLLLGIFAVAGLATGILSTVSSGK